VYCTQGLLPNDFANRVKVCMRPCSMQDHCAHMCQTSSTTSGLFLVQIAELNRHIDNMHQREDEYRHRVQVRR
jgi:hypothetical protein